MAVINATYKYNVVYVYKIDDDDHRGALKIGKTEIDTDAVSSQSLTPNCPALLKAATKRIKEQTQTSGVSYDLLYVIKAHFKDNNGNEKKFIDKDIHAILLASGYKRHSFPKLDKQPDEWFDVDLDTVKKAIKAIEQGRSSIEGSMSKSVPVIHFREEQEAAIRQTQSYFRVKSHHKMLWNAKMRFGKTLCSLELIRRCGYKRTLILTHRPAVKRQWFEDYDNINFGKNYEYGSKPSENQKYGQKFTGQKFEYLKSSGKNFIYFASMQDLRGSWNSDGSTRKNEDVFKTKWDLVIVDEAHEGTLTDLGKKVIRTLDLLRPHFLYLSGTPYNILELFKPEEIYTWDYVMEQEAKEKWSTKHPDEPNPYEGLAHMNILTYNLGTTFEHYNHSEEDYFEFPEFFRTWTGDVDEDRGKMPINAKVGDFVHEEDVNKFLDLLCKMDAKSNYPYSTEKYRNYFAHTLWVLPGVKAAAALSKMLRVHKYFGNGRYIVVNVAGEGDTIDNTDDEYKKINAVNSFEEKVKTAIKSGKPTITLTCYSGRLTTGVTIEEWTGVFMLAGGYQGNIAPYMQTIFRVQSPIKHYDYIKKECYAFDFAPDRTLTVIDDYIKKSERKRISKGKGHNGKLVEWFTKFCSIIAIDGSKTIDYDAMEFVRRVNHIYAEHVIRHGGKDRRLYRNYKDFNDDDFKAIAKIAEVINNKGNNDGKGDGNTDIVITQEGMTGDGVGESSPQESKPSQGKKPKIKVKKPKDPEQERRDMVYNTLNQISVRLPLMVFGAMDDVKTVDFKKFIRDIDEESWNEFMPKGISKDLFMTIAHIYDDGVFAAMASEIIRLTREADSMPITERTEAIASILSLFHYPDNETVLTPWNVVNMHMSDTLGGWDFFDKTHEPKHEDKPRFVDNGKITEEVFEKQDTKILELNSKSGVYPLYLAYSVFRERSKPFKNMFGETMHYSDKGNRAVWNQVVNENIYVICKTPMAEKITQRVLRGYDKTVKLNIGVVEDIIPRMKDKKQSAALLEELTLPQTYGNRQKKKAMKFDAIVSNPPYMIKDGGAGASATPVYNLFVDMAKKLNPGYFSIIMPAKWYNDGKGLAQFRTDMLHDKHIEKLVDFVDEHVCFPGVDVAGGVCYFLWDRQHDGDCVYSNVFKGIRQTVKRNLSEGERFIRYVQAIDILNKVKADKSYDSRVSTQKPFGLRTYVTPLESGDITLKTSEGKGPYDSSLIQTGKEMIYKWKVIISYLTAEHAGQTDKAGKKKILSSLDILKPGEICTETYLVVDSFDTKEEALALRKYLCTRLVRFLIALLAATQHLSKDKFSYVPVQDFKRNDIIPWEKSIPEIEQKLYNLYKLGDKDISFIEDMIKPMA